MCIRDSLYVTAPSEAYLDGETLQGIFTAADATAAGIQIIPVSYTHLRAHETVLDLVCRLLLEKKKTTNHNTALCIVYNNKKNNSSTQTIKHSRATQIISIHA